MYSITAETGTATILRYNSDEIEKAKVVTQREIARVTTILYDLGYLSQSDYFDENELLNTIISWHPSVIEKLTSKITGVLNITPDMLYYIAKKSDGELRNVLYLYRDGLIAKQNIVDLQNIKQDKDIKVYFYHVSGRIENNKTVTFNRLELIKLIDTNKSLVYLDYSIVSLDLLLQDLGVENVNLRYDDNSVLLGAGFTVQDDCKMLKYLLDGTIKGEGIYADKLYNKIYDYYTTYYSRYKDLKYVLKEYWRDLFERATVKSVEYINKNKPKGYSVYNAFDSYIVYKLEYTDLVTKGQISSS